MIIKTARLILRDLEEKDVDDLIEGAGNLNVAKNLLLVPHPYTKKDAEWFINHCKGSGNIALEVRFSTVLPLWRMDCYLLCNKTR